MISFPDAFIKRIRTQLGDDSQELLSALDTSPIWSLRQNPDKLAELAFPASAIPWHPFGKYLPERPSFVFDPLFHAGAYYVQEASSMMLHQLIDFQEDMRILDLCAAPGGKSTLLASAMSEGSLLIANEVIQSRAKVLAENITRWGNPNVLVSRNDPQEIGERLVDFFDLMLVDAPCSGEGMFRKDPQSRGQWSEEHTLLCAARQKRILADVLPSLTVGGRLIYSTCTFAPQENDEVIAWLLNEFEGQFELKTIDLPIEWGIIRTQYGVQCFPHKVQGEGMFFACVQKVDGERYESKNRKKKKGKAAIPKALKNMLAHPNRYEFELENDHLRAMPKHIQDELERLKGLRIFQSGVYMGKLHRKEFAPAHELAISTDLADHYPLIELNKEDALAYLRKEDGGKRMTGKGWHLVQYQGLALGWAKIAGGKWKNHYPTNWRIRKQSHS